MIRPMTDQAFPAPDDNYARKPQSIKQRIEGQLSDRIDFKLTARTKDRLSNKTEEAIKPATHKAYMPHINTWSDSRPQNNAAFNDSRPQ